MNPLRLDLPKDYRVNHLKALTSQDVNKLRPVINILVLLNPKGEALGLLRTLRDIATSITGGRPLRDFWQAWCPCFVPGHFK